MKETGHMFRPFKTVLKHMSSYRVNYKCDAGTYGCEPDYY